MPEAKTPKTAKAKTAKKKTTKTKTTKKRTVRRKSATRPSGAGALRVKQVRSGIGHAEAYRRTLVAIGLRHHQHEITVADTPSMRGMLRKVRHLVQVRAEEA